MQTLFSVGGQNKIGYHFCLFYSFRYFFLGLIISFPNLLEPTEFARISRHTLAHNLLIYNPPSYPSIQNQKNRHQTVIPIQIYYFIDIVVLESFLYCSGCGCGVRWALALRHSALVLRHRWCKCTLGVKIGLEGIYNILFKLNLHSQNTNHTQPTS